MALHVYRTLPEKLKAIIAVADRCFFNKGEIVNEKLRVASSFLGLCPKKSRAMFVPSRLQNRCPKQIGTCSSALSRAKLRHRVVAIKSDWLL